MLIFNIRTVFALRDIQQPFTYLVNAGFSRHTAHNLLNGHSSSFRLSHINKLCTLLHCTPNDLLVWSPNSNEILLPGHPLTTLKRRKTDLSWRQTLRTAPLDELEQITSAINKMKDPQSE